jgi:hypothetical protein
MGDSPEAIPTRLARGETADVVILDGESANDLARQGFVRAGSKVEFALSQIGIGAICSDILHFSARVLVSHAAMPERPRP